MGRSTPALPLGRSRSYRRRRCGYASLTSRVSGGPFRPEAHRTGRCHGHTGRTAFLWPSRRGEDLGSARGTRSLPVNAYGSPHVHRLQGIARFTLTTNRRHRSRLTGERGLPNPFRLRESPYSFRCISFDETRASFLVNESVCALKKSSRTSSKSTERLSIAKRSERSRSRPDCSFRTQSASGRAIGTSFRPVPAMRSRRVRRASLVIQGSGTSI